MASEQADEELCCSKMVYNRAKNEAETVIEASNVCQSLPDSVANALLNFYFVTELYNEVGLFVIYCLENILCLLLCIEKTFLVCCNSKRVIDRVMHCHFSN